MTFCGGKKAVLELLRTANGWRGNIPESHLDDGTVGKFRAIIKHIRLHMAYCAMISIWRQETYAVLTGCGIAWLAFYVGLYQAGRWPNLLLDCRSRE